MQRYLEENNRLIYIIHEDDGLAGFVVLKTVSQDTDTDWHVSDLIIIARLQVQGIGCKAHCLWAMHPGKYEESVLHAF